MLRIIALPLAFLVLAACTAEVKPAKVEIEPVTVKIGSQPDFCPPGQAKKGRC